MTIIIGARRGELCGLRWRHIDFDTCIISLEVSQAQDGSEVFEKDTKTHQQRRLVIDPKTADVLKSHRRRCAERAAALDLPLAYDAFVFSRSPSCTSPLVPDSVTQRYARMAKRLSIETSLHKLRHYSATELISGGVDIRTVAGRLGHGGGGATTLRIYTAWVSEADQRASKVLAKRLAGMHRPDLFQ